MKQTATLQVLSGCIQVEWDDDALTALLPRFFAPWLVKNNPGGTGTAFTITVTRGNNAYHITAPLSSTISCSTIPEIAMRFEEILTECAISMLEPALLIHSAAVDLNGKGALIAGDHGTGKTTLTLTALSSGFRALSDEIGVILDDSRSVIGFPRPFHVSANVMRLRPPVLPDKSEPYRLTDDFSFVFFDRYYQPSTSLSCIIFPDRRPGKTIIRETGELEAFRRLLPLGFNFYRAPDGRAGDLARLLKTVKAFTIQYEDHWEAIDGIREIIERKR